LVRIFKGFFYRIFWIYFSTKSSW